jgi:hypothetical protein
VAGQVLGCLLLRTSVDHHCSIEMSFVVKSYTQGRIMQLNQNSDEYLIDDKSAGCLLIGICHRENRDAQHTGSGSNGKSRIVTVVRLSNTVGEKASFHKACDRHQSRNKPY